MEEYWGWIWISFIYFIPAIYTLQSYEKILIHGAYGNAFMKFSITSALTAPCVLVLSSFSRYGFFWLFTLIVPLVQLYAFRFLYRRFIQNNGFPPRDVYHNFNSGFFNDRVFAFQVTLGFMFFSGLITIPFIAGTGSGNG